MMNTAFRDYTRSVSFNISLSKAQIIFLYELWGRGWMAADMAEDGEVALEMSRNPTWYDCTVSALIRKGLIKNTYGQGTIGVYDATTAGDLICMLLAESSHFEDISRERAVRKTTAQCA